MRKNAYIPEIIPESDVKMLEKYGGGHRVGFGKKIAVIVVDMTYEFIDDEYSCGYSKTGKPSVRAIAKLLYKAREVGIPIVYTKGLPLYGRAEKGRWIDKVRHENEAPLTAKEIVKDIAPRGQDIVISKAKPSGFFGTQLQSILTYLNVDTLIISGMVTSGCVYATVLDAFSYNYRVIVPEECVADRAEISHKVSLFGMDMKYADVMPLSDVLEHLDSITKNA